MTTTDPGGAIRPFADWLREQSAGETHDELSTGLRDLVLRVQDTGKKGSLTYTVTVEPMKGDTSTLVVTDNINLKLPEHARRGSIYYADDEHNLRREDPRQPALPGLLREVPRDDDGDVRELGEAR